MSYWFNFTVLGNGGNPLGYHVVNFLLPAANILLLRQIALRIAGVMARAEARDAWSDTEIRAIFKRRGNERAARRHYGDLRIYTLKALAWRRLGKPDAAVAALQQARLINPLDRATLGTLGDIDELGNDAAVAARMLQLVVLDDQNAIG